MTRPDWWPTWLPERCSNGHELGPGKLSQSWAPCRCPGAEHGGHQVQFCRIDGCGWQMYPPGHEGPELAPR